ILLLLFFFFSSRRRHTRSKRDWSSDVCSSDLVTSCSLLTTCYLPVVFLIASPPFTLAVNSPPSLALPLEGGGVGGGESGLFRARSEERRVGKECRCGWAAEDEKKK